MMKLASAAATVSDLAVSTKRLCDEAQHQLGAQRPDLILVFFTSHFEDSAPVIVREIVQRYPSSLLLGCSAESVVGPDREHERVPSMSLMFAHLPGVQLTPFRASAEQLSAGDRVEAFVDEIEVTAADKPVLLFFGDPFTVPINPVLEVFNECYPRRAIFGGMASGCDRPEQTALIIDDQVHRDGVVGVALSGAIEIQGVVSQGCRPIGSHLVITKSDRHIIHELGGKPALTRLREIVHDLPPEDALLAQQSMFLGRVINEYQSSFERGDFLIRNLLGVDPGSGAVAVADEMRIGTTVQFHVRDHISADEDLRAMLSADEKAHGPAAGALLFACNGRGTRMWTKQNHDVSVLRELCGPIPITGFFAAGELGPVSGRNFVHGQTASIAMFRPPRS